MYKVVDKVTHEYTDGDKVEMFRLMDLNNAKDRWGIDYYSAERHTYAYRFDTEQEALNKYNDLVME